MFIRPLGSPPRANEARFY
uniref:Uncharacterized protein n=1 Tax=Arundo donax TaxID=35708 RepID=A0A0A8YGV1_ARUDO